jgi:hypothetical protein
MKTLFLVIVSIFWLFNIPSHSPTLDRLNALIGDAGFIAEYGKEPDANADDDIRIKSHLKHVEQLLRRKNVSGLAPELREKRSELPDMLHTYWTAGAFPRNHDHPGERRPCFIDKDGKEWDCRWCGGSRTIFPSAVLEPRGQEWVVRGIDRFGIFGGVIADVDQFPIDQGLECKNQCCG